MLYGQACAHFPRVSPDNMVVLSLGAGNFPISIDTANQDMDWGIKDWVRAWNMCSGVLLGLRDRHSCGETSC